VSASTMYLGSVIIPAHNEEKVVGRCLDALLSEAPEGSLEVLVVCNGCTDRTAAVAAGFGRSVRVLEIAEASKVAALRAGDAAASCFPRLYLDADVRLRGDDAVTVLRALTDGAVLAARPPIEYDTARCSRLVRRYFRARVLVPGLMCRLWGAGVYGLSEEGHARVAPWPPGVADDLLVDSTFENHEIAVVSCRPVVVYPPRTSRSLVGVLSRGVRAKRPGAFTRAGDVGGPQLRQSAGDTIRGLLDVSIEHPLRAVDVAV
jgi:Glycosyl transferase family 2